MFPKFAADTAARFRRSVAPKAEATEGQKPAQAEERARLQTLRSVFFFKPPAMPSLWSKSSTTTKAASSL